MPKPGWVTTEATILKWHKREGERVQENEPVAEIESEKVTIDVKSPISGIVKKIVVDEGMTVPVYQPIAVIGEPEEEIPDLLPIKLETALHTVKEKKKVKASPLARRLAEEHNIDLTRIIGTGPSDRIVREDILQAIEGKEKKDKAYPEENVIETIEMGLIRRKTAERLSQMHRETPHVTLTIPIDLSTATGIRDEKKDEAEEKLGLKLTLTHIFAKIVSEVLGEFPLLNSRLEGNKIVKFGKVNLGIAVDVEEGLIVPVVRDAGGKGWDELFREISNLVDKAKRKKVSVDDLTGGTFTLSNMGMFDVYTFTPQINPPECAILGIGRAFKTPWVVNDQIEIKPIAMFNLTFDHRIIDGVMAARFLQRLKEKLEKLQDFAL